MCLQKNPILVVGMAESKEGVLVGHWFRREKHIRAARYVRWVEARAGVRVTVA